MSNFEELKATLPRRWLDYYQNNQAWIKSLMDSRGWWRKTPDGGKRPSADIIIAPTSNPTVILCFILEPVLNGNIF